MQNDSDNANVYSFNYSFMDFSENHVKTKRKYQCNVNIIDCNAQCDDDDDIYNDVENDVIILIIAVIMMSMTTTAMTTIMKTNYG